MPGKDSSKNKQSRETSIPTNISPRTKHQPIPCQLWENPCLFGNRTRFPFKNRSPNWKIEINVKFIFFMLN